MQFFTVSQYEAERFCVAVAILTGRQPALFRFPGGAWAVQDEILSPAAGRAVGRLLAAGVSCERITGPLMLAEVLMAGASRSNRSDGR